MNETRQRQDAPESAYRYSCAESAVGRLLVVMTDDAVVDVILGDDLNGLLEDAAARHPGARFVADCGVHDAWVARIVSRFEKPAYPSVATSGRPGAV